MKPIGRSTSMVFLFGSIAAGYVQANEKLATDSGCMACHQIGKKVRGPSFKEIAAKHKADAGQCH